MSNEMNGIKVQDCEATLRWRILPEDFKTIDSITERIAQIKSEMIGVSKQLPNNWEIYKSSYAWLFNQTLNKMQKRFVEKSWEHINAA